MVDVEQRALRALEQDALAGPPRAVEQVEGRRHERQNPWRDRQTSSSRIAAALGAGRPKPRRKRIVMGEQALDLVVERDPARRGP